MKYSNGENTKKPESINGLNENSKESIEDIQNQTREKNKKESNQAKIGSIYKLIEGKNEQLNNSQLSTIKDLNLGELPFRNETPFMAKSSNREYQDDSKRTKQSHNSETTTGNKINCKLVNQAIADKAIKDQTKFRIEEKKRKPNENKELRKESIENNKDSSYNKSVSAYQSSRNKTDGMIVKRQHSENGNNDDNNDNDDNGGNDADRQSYVTSSNRSINDKLKDRPLSQIEIQGAYHYLKEIIPHQEVIKQKNYQIQRFRHLRNYKFSLNPIIRDRAGKIIQHWWWRMIDKTAYKNAMANRIQAAFKGLKLRKRFKKMIDLITRSKAFKSIMHKVTRKFALKHYYHYLELRKKELLLIIMKIKLRQYYQRWRNRNEKKKKKEEAMKLMMAMRKENAKLVELKALYYHIWHIKMRHKVKQLMNDKKRDELFKKHICIHKIIQGLDGLAKRKGLSAVIPKLGLYFNDKANKDDLRTIMKLKRKLNEKRLMKCLNQWRRNHLKAIVINTTDDIQQSKLRSIVKHCSKTELKCSFNKFKYGLISALSSKIQANNSKIILPQLIFHLVNVARIKAMNKIGQSIKQRTGVKLLLQSLNKNTKKLYYDKYRNVCHNINQRNRFNAIIRKKINTSFDTDKLYCYLKPFAYWKSISKANQISLSRCKDYTQTTSKLKTYISDALHNDRQYLLDYLSTHVHSNKKQKTIKRFFSPQSKYIKTHYNQTIAFYFNQWKKTVVHNQINEMKAKFIQTTSKHQYQLKDNKALSIAFHTWRENGKLTKALKEHNKEKQIINGTAKLDKVNSKILRIALGQLHKPKQLFIKGKILSGLTNIQANHRAQLNRAFNKWKQFKMKTQFTATNKQLTNKLQSSHLSNIQSSHHNKNTQSLLKCFNKWKYKAIIIDKNKKYLFLNTLNKVVGNFTTNLHRRHSKPVFVLIKNIKVNPCNNKLLKIKPLMVLNDNKNLNNAWSLWKKNFIYQLILELKGKSIGGFIVNLNNKLNKRRLLKRFLYWKMFRLYQRRLTCDSLLKSFDFLNKGMIKPVLEEGMNAIQDKSQYVYKKTMANTIVKQSKIKDDRLLMESFKKWLFILKRIDMKSAIPKLQVKVLAKEHNTIHYYFNKWASYTKRYPIVMNQISTGAKFLNKALLKLHQPSLSSIHSNISHPYKSKQLKAKVIPHLLSSYKQKKIQCFNHWRHQKAQQSFNQHIITKYLKHSLLKQKKANEDSILSSHLKKWNTISKCIKPSITGHSLSSALIQNKDYLAKSIFLRNISIRHYYNTWKAQCKSIHNRETTMFIFKKIITPLLRKIRYLDIKYFFNTWHAALLKHKEDTYKQIFLKCYFMRKEKENILGLLKAKNNQWNDIAHATAYKKEQLVQFPDQIVKFKRAMCHNPKQWAFNSLSKFSFNRLKEKSIGSIVNKKCTLGKMREMRQAFRVWHSKMIENNLASSNMREMIQMSRTMPKVRKQYDLLYLRKITSIANDIYNVKQNKSEIISKYIQGLNQIRSQMITMRRAIQLRKLLDRSITKDSMELRTKMKTWNRNANRTILNEKAEVIQAFIKRYHEVKTTKAHNASVLNGFFRLLNHNAKRTSLDLLKFNSMQLPTMKSKQVMITKQTTRIIKNKERIDNNERLEYFNRWRNKTKVIQKEEAGSIIVLNMKKLSSKKLVSVLRNRKQTLNKRVTTLSIIKTNILSSYINRWKAFAHNAFINEKSALIQSFLKEKLNQRKQLRSIRNRNNFIYKGANQLNEVLNDNKTLAYKTGIFKHLLDNAKTQHLTTSLKTIPHKITQYYHNKYFNRWRENTVTYARRNISKIQQCFKFYFNKKQALKAIGTKSFLLKYISKLDKDKAQQLRIAFLHYAHQAVKLKVDTPVINLQKKLKGFLFRKKSLPLLKEEERKIEKEMMRLNRKSQKTHLMVLKWDNPLMKYWVKLKKKNTEEEIRNRLLKCYNKRNDNKNEICTCIIRTWNNKAKQSNVIENANVIQSYLLLKLQKLIHFKGVNQMMQLGKFLLNNKLNTIAKVNALKKRLMLYPYITLMRGLVNNTNQIKALSSFVLKKSTKDNNQIKKAFNVFYSHTLLLKLNSNARTIQKYIRLSQGNKYVKQQHDEVNKGLNVLIKTLMRMGYTSIQSKANKTTIERLASIFNENVLDIKKACLCKLQSTRTHSHLNNVIKVISNSNGLSLQYYFNKWNNINHTIKKLHSSQKILKNYQIYKEIKHQKKVITSMNPLIVTLSFKWNLILASCFIKWKRNIQMLIVLSQAKIIAEFVYKYNQNRKAKHNWSQYAAKLLKHSHINNIKQISYKQKTVKAYDHIIASFNTRVLQTFKDIHQYNKQTSLSQLINSNNLKTVQYSLTKWKSNDHQVHIQSSLNTTLKSIGQDYKIIQNKNQSINLNRIYKLFIYKILSKVFSLLTTSYYIQTSQIFYSQLQSLIKSKALYTYNKTLSMSKLPSIKELPFKGTQSNKKTIDKRRYLLVITPLFRNYLLSKMSKINAFTFDKILMQSLPYIFANHLRKFNKAHMLIQKKTLIHNMSSASKRLNLNVFIDEVIKFKLKESFKCIMQRKKLFNLVSIAMINKVRTKKRVAIKTVKGWKCYVDYIQNKKKYLELIEKSYLSIYKDLEDVIIGGENESGSSVINELISFNNKANK